MDVETLFNQINGAFRGTDDDAPTEGTPYFTLWLLTANRKKDEWARDGKQSWQSTFLFTAPNEPGTVATSATTTLTGTGTYFTDYNVGDKITVSGETERTIATITSNTVLTVTVAFSNTVTANTFTHKTIIDDGVQSYSLHRRFLVPADKAFGTLSDSDIEYSISKPAERARFYKSGYISGKDPQTLTFYDEILSTDPVVGGQLDVPGHYVPADMSELTDLVPVDDPYWLVYATASELAFNDLTYEDKYQDLNTKANNLWNQMVSNNRRGTNNNPRTAQTYISNPIRGITDSTKRVV